MKTEEDEAFDELAAKQGHWNGGFMAKRAMAVDKLQEPVLDLDGHVVRDARKPKKAAALDRDAEIARLNEKIEFLSRTNMLYSDWEHRETQVTSDLIRKGIEASKLNVELLSALTACLDWMEQLRTSGDAGNWDWEDDAYTKGRTIEAKLKEKNT